MIDLSDDERRQHDRNSDATFLVTLRQAPGLFARFWARLDTAGRVEMRRKLIQSGATPAELASLDGGAQ